MTSSAFCALPVIHDEQQCYKVQCEDKIFVYRLTTLLKYPASPLTQLLLSAGPGRIVHLDYHADVMSYIVRFQRDSLSAPLKELSVSNRRLLLQYSRQLRLYDLENVVTLQQQDEMRSVENALDEVNRACSCVDAVFPQYRWLLHAVFPHIQQLFEQRLHQVRAEMIDSQMDMGSENDSYSAASSADADGSHQETQPHFPSSSQNSDDHSDYSCHRDRNTASPPMSSPMKDNNQKTDAHPRGAGRKTQEQKKSNAHHERKVSSHRPSGCSSTRKSNAQKANHVYSNGVRMSGANGLLPGLLRLCTAAAAALSENGMAQPPAEAHVERKNYQRNAIQIPVRPVISAASLRSQSTSSSDQSVSSSESHSRPISDRRPASDQVMPNPHNSSAMSASSPEVIRLLFPSLATKAPLRSCPSACRHNPDTTLNSPSIWSSASSTLISTACSSMIPNSAAVIVKASDVQIPPPNVGSVIYEQSDSENEAEPEPEQDDDPIELAAKIVAPEQSAT